MIGRRLLEHDARRADHSLPAVELRADDLHAVREIDGRVRAIALARGIEQLQQRTGRPFPPSFHYLLVNYSFPAFEFGPMLFFANTGEHTFWELGKR